MIQIGGGKYNDLKKRLGWAVSVDQAKDRIEVINKEVQFEIVESGAYHVSQFGSFGKARHPIIIDILSPASIREKYNLGAKKAA